jgi:hypothetical protein
MISVNRMMTMEIVPPAFLWRALSILLMITPGVSAAGDVQSKDASEQTQSASESKKRSGGVSEQLDLSLTSALSAKKTAEPPRGDDDIRQTAQLTRELNALNQQVSQMQGAVQNLQITLKQRVSDQGGAVNERPESGKDRQVETTAMAGTVAVAGAAGGFAFLRPNSKKTAIFSLLMLLVGGAFSVCRKCGEKLKGGFLASWPFKRAEPAEVRLSPTEIGERSLKTPAYVENKPKHHVSKAGDQQDTVIAFKPEGSSTRTAIRNIKYVAESTELDAMIEEAELYALHGRWDNAIEILNNIILSFPEKIEAWLLLLSIFRNKASSEQFELIARTFLHTMGNNDTWKEIQEAGRSIDADNFLYFDPDYAKNARSGKRATPKKRRLLGTILVNMKALS